MPTTRKRTAAPKERSKRVRAKKEPVESVYEQIDSYRYHGVPDMPEHEIEDEGDINIDTPESKCRELPTIGPFKNFWRMHKENTEYYGQLKRKKKELKAQDLARKKQERKEKMAAKKAPKPRREQFYSEAHPKGFKTFKSLPYIPLLIFLGMYFMQILDAFKQFTGLLVSGVIFQQVFWQQYGASFSMVITLILGTTFVFYYFVWRMIFPDYMVRYANTDVYDGRLYWSDSSGIIKWWDKVYRSPERKVIRHWVHQRFIPLSPTVVYTTPEEWVEKRDSWSIVVHEKRKREIIKKERKRLHVTTLDGGYVGHQINLTYAQSNFAARSQELRDATTYLSQSNAHVQVDAVKGSTVKLSEDFKRRVLDARRKQRKEAEQSASEPHN